MQRKSNKWTSMMAHINFRGFNEPRAFVLNKLQKKTSNHWGEIYRPISCH